MVYGPPAGFYRNKPAVRIDSRYCTGCMHCVSACPQKTVFSAKKNPEGKPRPFVAAADACAGCGLCVRGCPTHAIVLYLT